jgi:hypothetical protein
VTAPAWAVLAVYTVAGLVFTAATLAIRAARLAVVRARWAWRCRGCPPPASERDPLREHEREELLTIHRGWKDTARPERTRT